MSEDRTTHDGATQPPTGAMRVGGGSGRILMPMGMNPFRPHRRSAADLVMVGAAFVVVAALILWAIYG